MVCLFFWLSCLRCALAHLLLFKANSLLLTNDDTIHFKNYWTTGKFVPENRVTNDDLSKLMDTTNDWIIERTGIEERRFIPKDSPEGTASMGVKAAEQAIERGGIHKDDIDLIVFATLSPDYYFPGSGVLVQDLLGIGTCPALDIRNQCSGFIYALSVADQYIRTGMYENILIIGSEHHSEGLILALGDVQSLLFLAMEQVPQ